MLVKHSYIILLFKYLVDNCAEFNIECKWFDKCEESLHHLDEFNSAAVLCALPKESCNGGYICTATMMTTLTLSKELSKPVFLTITLSKY